MPSREKLATRLAPGDLRGELRCVPLVVPFPFTGPFPFVISWSLGDCISTVNLSRDMEKVLPLPVAEVGEPSGELDIFPVIKSDYRLRSSMRCHRVNAVDEVRECEGEYGYRYT